MVDEFLLILNEDVQFPRSDPVDLEEAWERRDLVPKGKIKSILAEIHVPELILHPLLNELDLDLVQDLENESIVVDIN